VGVKGSETAMNRPRPELAEVHEFGPPRRRMTPWEAVTLPSLRNLTFALLVGVLLAGMAAGYTLTRPPVYESFSVIDLHQPDVFLEPGPGPVYKLNALRLKYAAIVDTDPIVGPIARRLHVRPVEIAHNVHATVPQDSLVMMLTARAGSREGAQRLAKELTDQIVRFAGAEQDADKVPADKRVQLRVLDTARPAGKASPTANRAITTSIFTGLTGVALAYVALQLVTAGRREL
jgi:hypothetical protein